jgi:hypothetical protein
MTNVKIVQKHKDIFMALDINTGFTHAEGTLDYVLYCMKYRNVKKERIYNVIVTIGA